MGKTKNKGIQIWMPLFFQNIDSPIISKVLDFLSEHEIIHTYTTTRQIDPTYNYTAARIILLK